MRLLAWAGCCLASAACAVVWWPLGLAPVIVVVALGSERVVHGWRRRRGGGR